MAGVAQNVVVSSESVFDPEVSSSDSFSLTLNSADGTSLQDLIDSELKLRISNSNLNTSTNTITTATTNNDKNVNLIDFDPLIPFSHPPDAFDLDSNRQFIINEQEHTSLHSVNNNVSTDMIEKSLENVLQTTVLIDKTETISDDTETVYDKEIISDNTKTISDNTDIKNDNSSSLVISSGDINDTELTITSKREAEETLTVNSNDLFENEEISSTENNFGSVSSDLGIGNKSAIINDVTLSDTEQLNKIGAGDDTTNVVVFSELTQLTVTKECMSSDYNVDSCVKLIEAECGEHSIPPNLIQSAEEVKLEKEPITENSVIEKEQEIKIPQFKDNLINEDNKDFDTWTTVAEATQDNSENSLIVDDESNLVNGNNENIIINSENVSSNVKSVETKNQTAENFQNGHAVNQNGYILEDLKPHIIEKKNDENDTTSEDITDTSFVSEKHVLPDYLVTNENNFDSEITESISSEKKTVKKKKSSEGVDSTTTKTKKTKKTKKSEEKENHISVMTNGHSNDLLKPPIVVTVEEDDLSNVCVRDLRRSFGDLHKACENAELTPVEPPNINNIQEKSSFSKFDQLQKKTLLHVRSSDSAKAQKQFNQGSTESLNPGVNPSCKSCGKTVFAMEQIKAERCVWHKNCFRCKECNKQLTLDIYSSHEGQLYCKPHFRELFKPKAVLDNNDDEPVRRRKPEMIIRENQPLELPPDVVRASDKPDLGLEELNSLNVKSRFQVFEKGSEENEIDRSLSAVNVKRSPSILSKLAKFQKKGMDVGVTDESLNGIDYEESSSSSEDEDGKTVRKDGVIRSSKLVERPTSFGKMEDVKRTWESGQAARKEERREERKQEIQSIRSRLFMGKQGKMKELYEQAVAESEGRGGTGTARKEVEALKSDKARAVRERFERGEVLPSDSEEDEKNKSKEQEDMSIFEAGISKKSRSLFLEMDANVAKTQSATPLSPVIQPVNHLDGPRRLSDVYSTKRQISTEDVVRSSDTVEDVPVETAAVSSKFKFFETYKAPEKERKAFRITPPREGQVKTESPEREIYRDPTIVRSDDRTEDDTVIKRSQTTSKMLSIFRQMEVAKESVPDGPKPLKRFTPPPDYKEDESGSGEDEESEEEEEEEEESEEDTGIVRASDKIEDEFLKQAQNAARAKTLKEKFEHWEPEKQSKNNAINMLESDQASLDSTKSLRARFESLKSEQPKEKIRPKVNRFV